MRNEAVPQECLELLETRLLRRGYESEGAGCCPIGLQETGHIPSAPESASQQGKEPDEAVAPVVEEGQESQEHIDQQRRPYLPAHGIGAVAQKIGQLQGLLDLFEEGFDGPAATVKVGDTGRTPLQVVGQENQFLLAPVDFDQGGDAAHELRVMGKGGGVARGNDLVAQDATGGGQDGNHFAGHVVLGAGDPEDAALEQIKEMGKVQVRLVEDDDLPGSDGRAEFAGAFGVVFPRGVDDGEAGQKAVEIQPQMALGRRLAPAVFGPVHAGGDQLDSGRVHDMDDAPEAPGHSLAPVAAGKTGLESLQMVEHRPENLFRQAGVSFLVGVREIIAAGRSGRPQRHKQTTVQSQPVADVVEANGMGKLRINQADQMAPRTEGARFLVHAGLPRQLRNQMRWNQIANLPQYGKLTAAWNRCFIHPCRVAGQTAFSKPFFYPLWDGCEFER